MEIKSISQKIFKTSASKVENNSSHTNPFGVNFKGNMISADVFESSEKAEKVSFKGAELAAKAGEKCRMLQSTIVGSLRDFSTKAKDSVADFGRRIKDNTMNLVGKLPKITGTDSFINNLNDIRTYSVSSLLNDQPIGGIDLKFERLLSAMEA